MAKPNLWIVEAPGCAGENGVVRVGDDILRFVRKVKPITRRQIRALGITNRYAVEKFVKNLAALDIEVYG